LGPEDVLEKALLREDTVLDGSVEEEVIEIDVGVKNLSLSDE